MSFVTETFTDGTPATRTDAEIAAEWAEWEREVVSLQRGCLVALGVALGVVAGGVWWLLWWLGGRG